MQPLTSETTLDKKRVIEQDVLWKNLTKAFALLFQRAQSEDILSTYDQRGFIIAPKERKVGVFDFDGKYDSIGRRVMSLEEFYEQGRRDARTDGFQQISAGRLFGK